MPESSAEKTEQPTPKKLRDARMRGQVCKSQDVNSTATIAAAFAFILIYWPFFLTRLRDSMNLPTVVYNMPFPDALDFILKACMRNFIELSLPIVLTVAFSAVLSNFFQIGVLLSFESLKPNLSKLNPIEGFKKLFSTKNVVELIKSLIKVSFLGIWIAIILYRSMASLLSLPYSDMRASAVLFEEYRANWRSRDEHRRDGVLSRHRFDAADRPAQRRARL